CVLERAGDGVVVFGREQHQSVAVGDQILQRDHGFGQTLLGLQVAVIKRDAVNGRGDQLHIRRRRLLRRAQQSAVVGGRPQAARQSDQAHFSPSSSLAPPCQAPPA